MQLIFALVVITLVARAARNFSYWGIKVTSFGVRF